MNQIPDPYGRSYFRGVWLDNATIAALKIAEVRLGYTLTLVQGIGGATASAGTHILGRAVDLAAYDHERKVRVLKDLGFAVWYRARLAGVWGAHIHAVLVFEARDNRRGLAESALRQIGSFDRGRNGLKGDGPDPAPYRPNPRVTFTRADYEETFKVPTPPPFRNNVTRARDRLVESIHAAGQAAALLEEVPERREFARAQSDKIRADRRSLKATLDRLPKK